MATIITIINYIHIIFHPYMHGSWLPWTYQNGIDGSHNNYGLKALKLTLKSWDEKYYVAMNYIAIYLAR